MEVVEAQLHSFSDAFTKLREATITFVVSPFCPHGTARLPLDGISSNFVLAECWKNLDRKFYFK
jgi:hypothetical protein